MRIQLGVRRGGRMGGEIRNQYTQLCRNGAVRPIVIFKRPMVFWLDGAPVMKPDLLTFQFAARTDVAGNMLGAIVNKLNSRDWMGKPARTCRVVKLHIKGKPGGVAEGYIIVRHRPHGWKIRQVSQDDQGHLLDDQKHPLPDGAEPFIIEFDTLEEVDFNGFDFGRLVA